MLLIIAKEFTTAPGPRRRDEGKHSGEEFREDYLLPRLRQAIKDGQTLVIDLDGTAGYGTSFLEESFGGLIRNDGYRLPELRRWIEVVSKEEPYLLDEINEYLEDAEACASDKK